MMVYEAGQNREGGRGAPGGRVVGLWDGHRAPDHREHLSLPSGNYSLVRPLWIQPGRHTP